MVVYGEAAEVSVRRALDALDSICPELPITVYRERANGYTDTQCSRWAKVTLLDWTPYDVTAYLDADTQVYQPIEAGFHAIEDGWDIALTPSQNQGEQVLWHVAEPERSATLAGLPLDVLQLQAGVMFFARNARTRALWARWRIEWERYKGQDQGALLRALHACPVKVWLLGQPFNNGAVIGHHFGTIRRGL
jgi:hypothetical protein